MSINELSNGKSDEGRIPLASRKSVSKEASADDDIPDSHEKNEEKPDPTRYGDWEKNGRCIDF